MVRQLRTCKPQLTSWRMQERSWRVAWWRYSKEIQGEVLSLEPLKLAEYLWVFPCEVWIHILFQEGVLFKQIMKLIQQQGCVSLVTFQEPTSTTTWWSGPMTMNFELERGGQEDSLVSRNDHVYNNKTQGKHVPIDAAVNEKKFKWHLPDIFMMQWWRRCKLFFFKVDLIHLDSQKRWVTVAAERIRWTEFHFGVSKLWNCQHLQWVQTHLSSLFNICQYLPREWAKLSQSAVCLSCTSPPLFTICAALTLRALLRTLNPTFALKGVDGQTMTDRCERLCTAKKGCAWRTLSKGWEEKFDFLGVDLWKIW